MNWKKQKVGEIFFVRILEFSGIFVIFVEILSDPAFVYDLTPKKAIFRVFVPKLTMRNPTRSHSTHLAKLEKLWSLLQHCFDF